MVKDPDVVYRKLFGEFCTLQFFLVTNEDIGKVAERNRAYYKKYAEDIHRVQGIIRHIQRDLIVLPSGGRMSVLRFRQLGMMFGFHGIY